MFRNILNQLCRGRNCPDSARPCSSAPPRIEELESRLAPSVNPPWPPPPIATVTNASVLIIPNLSSLTVTEVVTATVSNDPSVPPGTPPPPGARGGVVRINLNNQQTDYLHLNGNGQATATFTMPLFVFMAGQELTVQYYGESRAPSGGYLHNPSYFNSPLYVNFDNFLLPAILTFTPLSSTQMSSDGIWPPYRGFLGATDWPPSTSVNGETDYFGLFGFQYADPGFIISTQILGQQLPGIFAAALGAYDGILANRGA
jgi:hypothetical protein